MMSVLNQTLRRRRASLAWWTLAVVGMCTLLALAYPTVRDNNELDQTFAQLSPGVQAVLGLSGGALLSSPTGYLNSQFFANILPVMLLVFGVGLAAWSIAGDEAAGSLELLLANPISRTRVALARLGALIVLLTGLAAACTLTLAALAPVTGMDKGLTTGRLAAATLAATLMALTFAAIAFAVGAATGSRPLALATAAALAVAGYVLEGLSQQIGTLKPTGLVNPWHWLLATDPLRNGFVWQSWLPPTLAIALLALTGLPRLARRDLH